MMTTLMSGNNELVRDAIAVLRSVPPTGVDAAEFIAKVPAHRKRASIPWATDLDYGLRAVAPVGTRLPDPEATIVIADIHRDRTGLVCGRSALASFFRQTMGSLVGREGHG